MPNTSTPRFIFVRHGEVDHLGELTRRGIKTVQTTAEKIKALVGDKRVLIYSSPATRVLSTTRFIKKILGAGYDIHTHMVLNHGSFWELATLFNGLCENHPEDYIICVTHEAQLEEIMERQGGLEEGGAVLVSGFNRYKCEYTVF
ncbi:MAG: histidine phosphatase family protein [bacterium]|nr:histidine phosphatase family protein [bacterium]